MSTSANSTSITETAHMCPVCGQDAQKRCSRCNHIWYCSVECQKKHWKKHKPICSSDYQTNQYELHKKAFDAIIEKYNLKTEAKSTEIAELLTSGTNVTAPQFAEKFGMDVEEAVVFLEWVKVGVKFKEQSIDIAKKTGFANQR
eukprot:Nitzschia sp. Nitz4//scaffold77_size91520//10412//10843//NITZ4_004878-RA/size91520-processed-gene-0.105-mRNA-1//-1//CDS//3329557955//3361//frame0